MFNSVEQMLLGLGRRACETVEIQPRPESLTPLPKEIAKGLVLDVLRSIRPDAQLWTHQSEALRLLSSGKNVVVSTGTASGKSLVFQLYALQRLLEDRESRILVLYPLRALTNDQEISWKGFAKLAGLGPDAVDRIYGGIGGTPMDQREDILARSRVVLMTPDICQAWLMRRLDSSTVREFIDSLALVVLDEAHVYESVFGSNSAYLFRRLMAAKRRLSRRGQGSQRFQIVAATATIENPSQHLENLTGMEFSVVDEGMNGAPRSQRRIIHVEGPDRGADGERVIREILHGILAMDQQHRFLAFVDSRQGVERIVLSLEEEGVEPYRSGYEARDRRAIERALKSGRLQGVVSTSALELGIDIADMAIGVNLGVPQTRKSFRQRLGRVGRGAPGVFLVVAPSNAFTKYGESLIDYYGGSVEPSYLYLGNRFVQFAHSRCVTDETDALGIQSSDIPRGINWPDGFPEVFKLSRTGDPAEFETIARIGADAPHLNYPLRQLGEINVELKQGNRGFETELGDMTYQQAIMEAYPGATYLHKGRSYKVNQWNQGFNKLEISVRAAGRVALTRPIVRKTVTIDLSRDGVVSERLKQGATGLIAEAQVRVNERVDGFSVGNTQHLYRELRSTNPNMRRKQRNVNTTGIVLRITEEWFSNTQTRREVAQGLSDLLARDRSIAPQDIDSAHANIALVAANGTLRPVKDTVVVYDAVYGGLRLTESLYDNFQKYIERIALGASLSRGEGLVSSVLAQQLQGWIEDFVSVDSPDMVEIEDRIEVPEGWLVIYKPGSVVGVYFRGELLDRELVEPRFIDDPFNPGTKVLYYSYVDPRNDGGVSSIPDSQIVTSGHDWEWSLWNPETGEIREIDETE